MPSAGSCPIAASIVTPSRRAQAACAPWSRVAAPQRVVYFRRMERVTIYHNPVCGKSRGALEILRERGVASEVVEYLKAPLDRPTLERILALLPDPPAALVRKDKRFA